jgi:flavin-dependent dehydrogenase
MQMASTCEQGKDSHAVYFDKGQSFFQRSNKMNAGASYNHAVVIGGSIAGLVAARVLTNHFAQVTIVERDVAPDAMAFRKGAPQARHPHALLARGQVILEELFPGLVNELYTAGAIPANFGNELGFYLNGSWCQPFESAITMTICSRPLLETTVYRRVAALPGVRILHGQEMLGLCVDEKKERVTGLRLRDRETPKAVGREMQADLVVDASGRDSRAPEWLSKWGYTPPAETTVNAFAGYSTRIYRGPANVIGDWKAMYVLAMAPNTQRGAVIIPMEGDRWHVCLIGMAGDYPPTNEAGFMDFVRSLPSPHFYNVLKDAEPLTAPYGFRRAENRMRYYEKLPRYLENFVVTGDAVYAFNPVYGQGMSTAAMAAQTLDRCLAAQRQRNGEQLLPGLAQRFQKELAGITAGPWQMATGQDIRWPATEGGQQPDPITRLIQRYLDRVLEVAPHNPTVAEAFFHVQNMLKDPPSLMHPRILWEVLKPQARRQTEPQPPAEKDLAPVKV